MSSNITLSAATRQNLLSLQDTASLLSTTQTRLSTGKEVNSALDNPANFFTAQGLNQRSSTLNSLLDGISNGVQTIQAAATGLTNLSKLTDQLKSTAQQATQATSAVTAKAALTTKILNGAIDTNLISTGATKAASNVIPTAVSVSKTGQVDLSTQGNRDTAIGSGKSFQIDGVNISLSASSNYTSQAMVVDAINSQLTSGNSTFRVAANGANIDIQASNLGDNAPLVVSSAGQPQTDFRAIFGAAALTTGTFAPSQNSKIASLGFTEGDNFVVNGYSVSMSRTDTIGSLAAKVATATNGEVSASFDTTSKQFTFTAKDAKTQVNLGNGSSATSLVTKLGYTTTTSFAAGLGSNGTTPGTNSDLNGKTLTVSTGSGVNAKTASVSFGAGAGQIQTLDQLNLALSSANAMATMDSAGRLTVSTNNDAASQALTISGTAVGTDPAAAANSFLTASASATLGGDGLAARSKLVSDYNNLLNQIDQMANDSSFNGVNLLKGDQMKISFNEDASSNISVKGVNTNSQSLKLTAVTTDDFKDNSSINKVMDSIKSASSSLKSQSATYASNLSVVQNRQDFTKNLANVLDTGAANLTNADLNEEAANSQALSTRNSLAVSALSLANQAQQGILQLLR